MSTSSLYVIEGEERAHCGLNNADPDQSPAIVMCLRTKNTTPTSMSVPDVLTSA